MSENCDEALAKLYTYLDDELDPDSVRRIRAHLEDCHPCYDTFSFERRLRLVVRERLREEVPETMVARIRQIIQAERDIIA